MAEHNDDWIKIEMTRFHWLVVLCTATGGRRRENKSPLLGCFFFLCFVVNANKHSVVHILSDNIDICASR